MDPITMSAMASALGGGGGGLPGMPSLDGLTGGNAGPSNAQGGEYTNSLDFSYNPPKGGGDMPPWMWLGIAAIVVVGYIAAKR
ncbi:hypothetical protein [Photobacterium arenosum]|uniref:hypothetical protein n=1 Tax=Photobacterium arenosum TaxID=2774143 RepID=UPI00288B2DE8|nr:hypothetical protein [Photobacterium arenosum]